MLIKGPIAFQASLDDGLTVTTFARDKVHDVPDDVGKMAIKHFKAKEVKRGKGKE